MLTLHHLYKSFEGQPKPILNGVHLEVREGEFCVLIGSNGSGKSTLMKCMTGEYALDSGEIRMYQRALSEKARSRHIAIVTQNLAEGTIGELTLLENMVLSLLRGVRVKPYFYGRYRNKARAFISALGMGLEAYLDTPLQSLSGGQQQMIATIMAIASKPEILLLDEHTSALDPSTQQKLMALTADTIKTQGMTAFMITHQLSDALKYGSRLVMLHQGKVVLDLNAAEKARLSPSDLLALYRQYEAHLLLSEGGAL
ncbi:MAG: ATP-binding cassette domain-containing protein [Legionellaceae bacterium]|nr:ATP-binding cassette domain-containing protein [Legionellaceae bacterium]